MDPILSVIGSADILAHQPPDYNFKSSFLIGAGRRPCLARVLR
jgi:hypothetical protein